MRKCENDNYKLAINLQCNINPNSNPSTPNPSPKRNALIRCSMYYVTVISRQWTNGDPGVKVSRIS